MKTTEERIDDLNDAINEAKKFLKRASEWKKVLLKGNVWQSKEGGSCKRSSMDLTRSLAELRRN